MNSRGPGHELVKGMDLQDSILGTSVLFFYPSLITLIAILSAAAGVWLTSFHGAFPPPGAVRRRSAAGSRAVLGSAGNGRILQLAGARFCGSPADSSCWRRSTGLSTRCARPVPLPIEHDHCATRLHGFATAAAGCGGAAQRAGRMERGSEPGRRIQPGPHRRHRGAQDSRRTGPGSHRAGIARLASFRFSLVRAGADGDRGGRGSRIGARSAPRARKDCTRCWRSPAAASSTWEDTPCTANCAAAGRRRWCRRSPESPDRASCGCSCARDRCE